eukprot:1035413-Pyramimonas_sp.AAC.1
MARRARFSARRFSDLATLGKIGPGKAWRAELYWRPLNELLRRRIDGEGEAVGTGGPWGVREQRTLRGLLM